jgi:hypothetical protein
MTQMAIIVEFETLPGKEDAFLTNIRAHAAATLAEEPVACALKSSSRSSATARRYRTR